MMSQLENNQIYWNEKSIDDHTLNENLMRRLIEYSDYSECKNEYFGRYNIVDFAIIIKELFLEKFKIFNILYKISNFLKDSYDAIDIVAANSDFSMKPTILTSSKRIALKHELKNFIDKLKIKFDDVTDFRKIIYDKTNCLDYYNEFEN